MWKSIKSWLITDSEYKAWLRLAKEFLSQARTGYYNAGICRQIDEMWFITTNVQAQMSTRLELYMWKHNLGGYIWEVNKLGAMRRARLCLKFAYLTLLEQGDSND